jgi:hypothetical protein
MKNKGEESRVSEGESNKVCEGERRMVPKGVLEARPHRAPKF